MDIFDFAMKMEKDGQAYYKELAKKAENAPLKRILHNLAEAEGKHYEVFKKFKEGKTLEGASQPGAGENLLQDAKNVFQQMAAKNEKLDFSSHVISAWQGAQEIEKRSVDFYREKAGGPEASPVKNAILRIADEEHHHWVLIESILQFLRRPKEWLENAEWHHLEEY